MSRSSVAVSDTGNIASDHTPVVDPGRKIISTTTTTHSRLKIPVYTNKNIFYFRIMVYTVKNMVIFISKRMTKNK